MDKHPARPYELTYLLSGSMSESEVNAVKTDVENLLKKYKATAIEVVDWDKKPTAYILKFEGKKNREAFYTHIMFHMSPSVARDFEHDVYLMNKIMRHLVLLAEDEDGQTRISQTKGQETKEKEA